MSAKSIMQTLNPRALQATENGREIFIEDVTDPDGRMYRIEYWCHQDGSNATAYLRYNPWGYNTYSYSDSHLDDSDGLICVGPRVSRVNCPYGLDYTVRRARTWCTGYSYLREHGYDRTCQEMPDWKG